MKQFTIIKSIDEFEEAKNKEASLFYFSHENCNVCKALKPKVLELLSDNFPEINAYYVDTVLYPDIAGQNSIFTNPVILIYFDGKEFYRKARYIGMSELHDMLAKPYEIIFEK